MRVAFSESCYLIESVRSKTEVLIDNAIHHRMAHPTGMAHFVADLPLHLNITTPQQAI
jgi:hypothetical protein